MLVLARHVNEQIVIDGEIFITVLEVTRGGQVRLGIKAPRHRQIYRYELWVEIEKENRDALANPNAANALNSLLAQQQQQAAAPGVKKEEPPASAR